MILAAPDHPRHDGPFDVAAVQRIRRDQARQRTPVVSEVAERLIRLAEDGPSGRAPDLAGPQVEQLSDMVRRYAHAIGFRGRIPAVSLPGTYGKALRSGALLPGPDADLGTQTYAEWLNALPDA